MTDSTEKSDVVQTSDDTALWMPLVAGMLLLVLATVLTWVSLDRAALFNQDVSVVERAKASGNLGKVAVAQPQAMDLTIARWAAVGVAASAVMAAVLAVRTKRMATAIVLVLCVVLFFFTVLSGVFTL